MNSLPDFGFDIQIDRFCTAATRPISIAVAIPARNEVERIVPCLAALAAQTGLGEEHIAVVVLLNNCNDGTLRAIAEQAAGYPHSMLACSVELPASHANAGWARRLAMDQADKLLDGDGLLLTTDADSVAFPNWVEQVRREFDADVDALAGYVTADWNELSRFPQEVLLQGALEWEYQGLAAELEAKADPQPYDPWPRHNQNCGANLAIRASLYRHLGGLPPEPVGEDRALCDAIRAADGKLRHSLAAHVTASARTVGRASGGMADALRTRGTDSYLCDDILEPALTSLRRNRWRAQARRAWARGELPAWMAAKTIKRRDEQCNFQTFGLAWASIERDEPRLARQRLRSADLPKEILHIRRILAAIALQTVRCQKPQMPDTSVASALNAGMHDVAPSAAPATPNPVQNGRMLPKLEDGTVHFHKSAFA